MNVSAVQALAWSKTLFGITAVGAYLPKSRLSRAAISSAHNWLAPHLQQAAVGERTMAFWDEDAITMAVEAARDLFANTRLGRETIDRFAFASTTPPFSERSNATIAHRALQLAADCQAVDVAASRRCAVDELHQALVTGSRTLIAAAHRPVAKIASLGELRYSDGGAAVAVGSDTSSLLAVYLGGASRNYDFVDSFRTTQDRFPHDWEERWVREEGYLKIVPEAVNIALQDAGLNAADIDHFILPCPIPRVASAVASACGVSPERLTNDLMENCGIVGPAHSLLMLMVALERARCGEKLLVAEFGQGCTALVLQAGEASGRGNVDAVSRQLNRGVPNEDYFKLLVFNDLVPWDRGMRAEQIAKTALTVAYRNSEALLGFIGARDPQTGAVQFPPSRIAIGPDGDALRASEPYPLSDLGGTVASRTADALAFSVHPPSCYGLIDINGGGRLMMDFTDIDASALREGDAVSFTFRIKDIDVRGGSTRYFWKAVATSDVENDRRGSTN